MGNERKLRLIQVAKEFKVGLNTITDFLQKKGIKSDGSPNTLVDAETYAVLEKEFGANRSAASAVCRPLTNTPDFDCASEIVQLPSSYRVNTACVREIVGYPSCTSQPAPRPTRLSQCVTGICVPSGVVSQAQTSGSCRNVSRLTAHRTKIPSASTGNT